MTSRRRSTLSGIEPSSESSSLLEYPVQPLSGYQTLLLTVHSTSKWATLFLSNPGSPTAGVPQGSPPSPTLFILFIKSVTSITSCPTKCFADDTCTITPGLPFITAQQKIQSDVTALATGARDHKLIIHPEKTVCMLFHHPRHHPLDLNIFLNNHAIPKSTSTSTLVLYFHPPFPGHLMSNILSLALLQCLVFFVISTPTSIFHLAVYQNSTSVTYALFWSMAAPLLSVCLFALQLLACLKLSNRRHCPFVASILLVSLPFLNAVALFYSDFSFLFLMTMSLTTRSVSVIGHLSTLPLHAHYAIHLPFASHALAHLCLCPLLSTSLLLPTTLLAVTSI